MTVCVFECVRVRKCVLQPYDTNFRLAQKLYEKLVPRFDGRN